jgi:predicted acylesterase/phospholipase RssA
MWCLRWTGFLLLTVLGCTTKDIIESYNEGSYNTVGTPSESRCDAERRVIRQVIEDELSLALYEDTSPRPEDMSNVGGTKGARSYFTLMDEIYQSVVALMACDGNPNDCYDVRSSTSAASPPRSAAGGTGREPNAQPWVQRQFVQRFKSRSVGPSPVEEDTEATWTIEVLRKLKTPAGKKLPWLPVKPAPGDDEPDTIRSFRNAIRFSTALEEVARRLAQKARERLILADLACSIDAGESSQPAERFEDHLRAAIERIAAYQGEDGRSWHRHSDRPVVALAVSGGSSDGMFSAGVVWQILSLVDAYKSRNSDHTHAVFDLVSGTSAGALIAAATDIFQTTATHGDRQAALDRLAFWFTCLSADQLYCVNTTSPAALLDELDGLVTFDGVSTVLRDAYMESELSNSSEILLNTVDFGTGSLIALSDQDPFRRRCLADVHTAILSSISLPIIATPVPKVREGDAYIRTFLLDGGVRAELPLMPLLRRGAHRVVAVSSAHSEVLSSRLPVNAGDVVQRYIGLMARHTSEQEIEMVPHHYEARALRELRLCQGLESSAGDDCRSLLFGERGGLEPDEFEIALFNRREFEVDSAPGYSFDPRKSIELFRSGAEEVRARCDAIAEYLGLANESSESLCSQPLPDCSVCDRESTFYPRGKPKWADRCTGDDYGPPGAFGDCSDSLDAEMYLSCETGGER